MNTENRLIARIPFCGFYCSIIDQFLDSEIESYIDWRKEEKPDYEYHYNQSIDWLAIAKKWVIIYQDWLKSEHGLDIALEFEKLESPREYNFTWYIEIDEEKTAKNLLVDYSEIEINSATFYYR